MRKKTINLVSQWAHTHTTPKPIIFAKHNIIYIFIQRIYILTCSVSYRVEPYLIIYDHAPTKKKLIFKNTQKTVPSHRFQPSIISVSADAHAHPTLILFIFKTIKKQRRKH